MTRYEGNEGATRDELVQRVALMEAMIVEGRRTTTRNGWVFVMWGLLYYAAVGWEMFLPARNWAWPVCIVAGIVIIRVVAYRRKLAGEGESLRSRSIVAVWRVMGIALTLFVVAAVVTHHYQEPVYIATILFMIGLAHGTSAMILRWGAQWMAAVIWWAAGTAAFFYTSANETLALFLTASFFGMVLFGLYAMMLERRRGVGTVQRHA